MDTHLTNQGFEAQDDQEVDTAVAHTLDDDVVHQQALKAVDDICSGGPRRRLLLRAATITCLLTALPGLEAQAHRGLLVQSLVPTSVHVSVDTSGRKYVRSKVSAPILAAIEGKVREHRHRKYNGQEFLDRHKQVVPGFRHTGWKYGQYCRQVADHGLPPELLDVLVDDLSRPLAAGDEVVDFVTLKPILDPTSGHGYRQAREERERARREALGRCEVSPWPLQRELLILLNNTRTNVVARLVRQNAGAAIDASLAQDTVEERVRSLAAIREVQFRPYTYYAPSRRLRTPRVFPTTVGPLMLPKEVRRALFRGCLEVDLRNAQLACAACAWDVQPLLKHLRRHGTVWPHLLAVVAGVHAGESAEVKGVLKTALYSVVFGMSTRGLRRQLTAELSPAAAAAFLNDSLITALLAARRRALADVDRDGGATDCFGNRRSLTASPGTPERAAECRSVLGGLMQALELQVLEGVVHEAARNARLQQPAFRIVAWQHDGLTIKVRADGPAIERRLVRLVNERATALGIPTALDTEWLGCAPVGQNAPMSTGSAPLTVGRATNMLNRASLEGGSGRVYSSAEAESLLAIGRALLRAAGTVESSDPNSDPDS